MALATDAAVGPLPAAPCAGFAIAILRCGNSIAILAAAVLFSGPTGGSHLLRAL
jgi:hypothetical protein